MSEQLIKTPCAFGDNGNFLLERELGSGGMGGVYMGRDKMLDRPVAVKVMLREYGSDAEFVEKFKKEAQSAARLIHPNIAQIYSYGISDGMPYMAMELVAGGSLYSLMNANPGKTDIPRVIKICQQVAQALQCSTDQGFVHGDIKPENILLDANGNAKIVDFGLAAMQKDTAEIWGTPYYISPEKVKKEQVDFRADMYSLGGTLYHALTGVAPFEGADSVAVVKKRFEGAPRKPSEIRPELTPAIDALVMKMLAFNREDRYLSFEALLEAFKKVLTTGLSAEKSATGAVKTPTTVGGRRPAAIRGRRVALAKRPPAAGAASAPTSSEANAKQDEDDGGGIGIKVVGFILGAILLVGGVIGGLVWYQVADKKAKAAADQAQIASETEKARGAIRDTLTSASKFADEFDAFAARAVAECQKPTDELAKILPAEQAARLKPGPSKELLDAIASTNAVPKSVATAVTNATAVVGKMAEAMKDMVRMPKFREPTESEKDPASPEGKAYRDELKAFMDKQATMLKEKLSQQKGSASGAEKKSNDPAEMVVITMNELWNRAYSCQASAIRIRQAIRKVVEKGAEADQIHAQTKANMNRLGEISRTIVDLFEQAKNSKDVENVRKGISFIKAKGAKTVEQTVKRLRIEKLEAERKKKAEETAKAEKERQERLEAERKALVEKETAEAKAKFNAIAAQGCFRQLDWKSALRQLDAACEGFKTAEGQIAAGLEKRKINDMKLVHDIFLKHLKGHLFRGKLKGFKVTEVDEQKIFLLKPDGKSKTNIFWQKFYKDYPGNLNEIFNLFVVNTRKPESDPKFRISSLRQWADAMTGVALTLQIVCSEVPGATEKAEMLIKDVVRELPEYGKTAREIFPTVKFDEAELEKEG